MKEVYVGTYEIGYEQVRVVLADMTGGSFNALPGKGEITRIRVGADYTRWDDVISVFLHEAFELVAWRIGCRYENSNSLGRDLAGFLFMFDHPQFNNICSKVAELMAPALPDLLAAWKKWQVEVKKKKKGAK